MKMLSIASATTRQGRRQFLTMAAMGIVAAGATTLLPLNARAASRERSKSREVFLHPRQPINPGYVAPGGARIYRDESVPGGLRTDHDPPPAYDDPSKFGGG